MFDLSVYILGITTSRQTPPPAPIGSTPPGALVEATNQMLSGIPHATWERNDVDECISIIRIGFAPAEISAGYAHRSDCPGTSFRIGIRFHGWIIPGVLLSFEGAIVFHFKIIPTSALAELNIEHTVSFNFGEGSGNFTAR